MAIPVRDKDRFSTLSHRLRAISKGTAPVDKAWKPSEVSSRHWGSCSNHKWLVGTVKKMADRSDRHLKNLKG